jgi:hypothetical protein
MLVSRLELIYLTWNFLAEYLNIVVPPGLIISPFQGLRFYVSILPGALPRAITFIPFGDMVTTKVYTFGDIL